MGVGTDLRLHVAGYVQVPAHLLDGVEADHKATILQSSNAETPSLKWDASQGCWGDCLESLKQRVDVGLSDTPLDFIAGLPPGSRTHPLGPQLLLPSKHEFMLFVVSK